MILILIIIIFQIIEEKIPKVKNVPIFGLEVKCFTRYLFVALSNHAGYFVIIKSFAVF